MNVCMHIIVEFALKRLSHMNKKNYQFCLLSFLRSNQVKAHKNGCVQERIMSMFPIVTIGLYRTYTHPKLLYISRVERYL